MGDGEPGQGHFAEVRGGNAAAKGLVKAILIKRASSNMGRDVLQCVKLIHGITAQIRPGEHLRTRPPGFAVKCIPIVRTSLTGGDGRPGSPVVQDDTGLGFSGQPAIVKFSQDKRRLDRPIDQDSGASIAMSVFSDLYSEIKESCGWETIPYELTAKLGKICTRRDIDFLISEIVRFGNVDLSDDSGDGADELWRLGTSISYILAFAGEKSVGPLLSLLEEGGRFASRYAARSLSLLRAEDALEPLIRKMQNETDIGEQLTYVAALGEIGSPGALPFLLPLLNNSGKQNEAHLVAAAAESIGKIGEAASIKPLGKVLRDDSDWLARLGAAEGLGHIVHPDTVVELKSHLNEPDKRVLEAIHKSLSAIQSQL